MVAGGALHLDIESYGGLTLSNRGWRIIEGTELFHYRPDTTPIPRSSGKLRNRSFKPVEEEINLSSQDQELLANLKSLRSQISGVRGVPAYIVFSDRSLIDMAQQRPANKEDFAAIHGVGKAKLRKFADEFLALIAEHN